MKSWTRVRSGHKSYRFGLWAETVARLYLWAHGYRILAARYRTPQGEIDLIVRRGRAIAFVEVKGRAQLDAAADAITPRQQARLGRAAAAFLGRHPQYAGFDLRLDALFIAPFRWPLHIRNAWPGQG